MIKEKGINHKRPINNVNIEIGIIINSNITFSNAIQIQAASACNALWQLLLAFSSITPNCGTNDSFE